MPRGNQLVRQWQLLQFLARPGGLTVADAVGQLDCTVRTVWRDLRVLQDAGFPIYDERDGRHGVWRVNRSFQDRAPVGDSPDGGASGSTLRPRVTTRPRR